MLKSRMFFGLNTSIKKNAHFISDEEILYPAGGVITIHNHREKTQRYINFPSSEKEISVISVSLKKKCIAVAEKGDIGEKPRIFVYDLETLQRKTVLGIPFEVNTREFMRLIFTHDGVHIAALTGGPDYIMYYYNWQSGKIESQAKANNPPSTPGPVTDMAVNPKDATIVVFVGVSLFRLLSMSENVWRQYGFQKAQNFSILSVCWLTDDRVLASCKDGKVIIVQSGDLNGVYNINDINEINIVTTVESKKEPVKTFSRTASKFITTKEPEKKDQEVRCLVAINSGFLYSQKPGQVVYFEKTSKTSYKRSTTFVIKKDVLCHDADYDQLYYIHCIGINLDGTKLLCTTNRSQIYWADLQGNKDSEVQEFDVFEEPLHHGPVAGLSTCLWKPIFMTCGEYDNSVRIWNYATMKLLLNQTFIEDVKCISLHPTGLYALIGFSDKVRFFLVLINELQTYREFDIRQCHILSFSNNGHLFATECDYDIVVFSSITFHKLFSFQGHYQQITSLKWSYNDLVLHTSSTNGAVYQWSIEKNTRISDVVMQEVEIKGLIALDDKKTVCIANDGSIREITDVKLTLNTNLNHENSTTLDAITFIPSANCLLLSGKNGIIISLKYPINEEPEFSFYSMHNKSVKQFCIMNKEQTFVSCGIDGTVCIWDIVPNMGQPSDNYFKEILINVDELAEKNQNLYHLESRIHEMAAEHTFEIKRLESSYTEKIQLLEENNSSIVKNLKKRIKTLEKEHSMELNRIHLDITQMRQTHTMEMDKLDSNFNNKLLYEFQKYDLLKDEMDKMKNRYEKELATLKQTQDTEKESQKTQFTKEIDDSKKALIQLQSTLDVETRNHRETLSNLQGKFSSDIDDLKANYESQLKAEKTKTSNLETELGITKKKLAMLQKEKEDFKSSKMASETEYDNLKQKHSESLNQIVNLKKIIQDKIDNIEQEKKHIAELRKNLKEMAHSKSNLDTNINLLEKQIQSNDHQLELKSREIHELEKTIKKEEKDKIKLQNQILHLTTKLRGKESLMQMDISKLQIVRQQIESMKNEIYHLKDLIQNPIELKKQVKELLSKYTTADKEAGQ
ncbi:cilia- and flagella-associated protein 57 isoform X2 [Planococcus citri]|uniref:cilia- and flagella-associated protein 57 isoform X2 n=1 Tax=Planococcus citri TaxID=170843 RepID=UPI0031F80E4F